MAFLDTLLSSLTADKTKLTAIEKPSKYSAGETLYFPGNITPGSKGELTRYPHFMKFAVYNFEGGGTIGEGRKITNEPVKSIFLHVPDNLTQTQSHEYSVESITTALARYGLAGALVEDLKNYVDELKNDAELVEAAKNNSGSLLEIAGTIAQQILGAGQGTPQLLSAILKNQTVNPRYESIYTGSRPREFTFDFKLAPQNQKEAESILNIVKAFRYFSAPERAAEFRYLVPPNPFDISFYFNTKSAEANSDTTNVNTNQALFKIKKCVLQGVDVNYSTTGQFATFKDGMPVEIAMQLRFTELQTLTKKDIEGGF